MKREISVQVSEVCGGSTVLPVHHQHPKQPTETDGREMHLICTDLEGPIGTRRSSHLVACFWREMYQTIFTITITKKKRSLECEMKSRKESTYFKRVKVLGQPISLGRLVMQGKGAWLGDTGFQGRHQLVLSESVQVTLPFRHVV